MDSSLSCCMAVFACNEAFMLHSLLTLLYTVLCVCLSLCVCMYGLLLVCTRVCLATVIACWNLCLRLCVVYTYGIFKVKGPVKKNIFAIPACILKKNTVAIPACILYITSPPPRKSESILLQYWNNPVYSLGWRSPAYKPGPHDMLGDL